MIKKIIEDALNEQVNAEMYSAYLYLSMAAHFESVNLSGFANWMEIQAQEEFLHAKKIYNFILERGGKIVLKAIDAPKTDWQSPQEVFEDVCEHEQKVTGLINGLMDLAIKESDHATNAILQWFVSEQVEEEANASMILEKIKLAGPGSGLFMIDQELAARKIDMTEYTSAE